MLRFLLLTALMFACGGTIQSADAPKPTRAFFAMDNGLGSVAAVEEKAALLKEFGYAGIGWRPGHTAEMLKALDAQGLKMFSFYVGIGSDPESRLDTGLAAEFELLKGRETIVWVVIKKGKGSDEANAVRLVREVADLAAASHLRVALYPHAGCYVETIEGALKIVKLAERKNLGLSFNLCHFLKTDTEEHLDTVLKAAAPHLMLVQTNGADSGETRKMGWDRLIQPFDAGTFDNGKLFKALDAIGYAGPVGLQCYQVKVPAREHLSRSMDAWRKLNGLADAAPTATGDVTSEWKTLLEQAAACDHGQSRAPLTALLEKAQATGPGEWPAIESGLVSLLADAKATALSKLAVCDLLAHRGGKNAVAALSALLGPKATPPAPDAPLPDSGSGRDGRAPGPRASPPAPDAPPPDSGSGRDGRAPGPRASPPAQESKAELTAYPCSHAAAYALSQIDGPEAEKALLEALPGIPVEGCEDVIAALGVRRCGAAVEPLAKLLASAEEKPVLHAAICTALGRIGNAPAAAVLRKQVAVAPALQPATVDACLQCAARLSAEGATAEARKLYEALLALKAVPLARAGAVKGLAALSPDTAPELLAGALTDEERQVRYAALAALKTVPGEALTTHAAGLLPKRPPDQASQLIEVLTIRGDPSARPAILEAASAKGDAICVAALNALAAFGKAEDVPLLVEKLNAPDPVSHSAAFALTRLPGRGVAARACELLKGMDDKHQVQLIGLLASRADPHDADVLCDLVSNANPPLAAEAARGIKLMGGEPAFRNMTDLLRKELENAQVRPAVETAVARIVKRVWRGEASNVLALMKDAPERQRVSLLTVLSLIGDDRTLSAMIEACRTGDDLVKDAAVRGLANWPTPTPLEELLEIAKSTSNETHHVLAMRGYIRMLDLLKEKPPANLEALYEEGRQVARRDEERRALDPAKAAAKPAARPPVGYE